MVSGQQKAQQNFEFWKTILTDNIFKQVVFNGQLNRIKVTKGIGCGKSALNQKKRSQKNTQSTREGANKFQI